MTYHFNHSLPPGKKLKLAFLSLTATLILCVCGYFVAEIFWDEYTYQAYSLRYATTVTAGWPASLQGWSIWLGVAIIIVMPMMYFMQDWKNPSLGITDEGLFINQQMIRNQLVPFSNIASAEKSEKGYRIKFKDNSAVFGKAGFFKPFVKYNLENDNFFISEIHSGGSVAPFFEELNRKIKA